MMAIQAHFSALDDARFGVIRIFELVEEKQAIIMAFSTDPRLRDLVAKNSILRMPFGDRGGSDLSRAFEHAGAWLRAYHTMEKVPEQAEVRHQRREDYLDSIGSFTQFLGEKCEDVSFFTAVKEQTEQAARAILPPVLPIGPGHGDFALRNILVGEGERVTVIDTLTRLCVPIYEDLAYFLVGLRGNRLQVFSQGLAFRKYLLASYEQAFLAGYFAGQAVPRSLLHLFEIQALLDKWSSLVVLIRSGRRGTVRGAQLKLTDLYYRRLMKELLRALSEVE
jgi:aminoglycoside phosphotransferase (APT) family kinase protein